ncbi:unnamed protein product, partial [Prorocentrum cordatum]
RAGGRGGARQRRQDSPTSAQVPAPGRGQARRGLGRGRPGGRDGVAPEDGAEAGPARPRARTHVVPVLHDDQEEQDLPDGPRGGPRLLRGGGEEGQGPRIGGALPARGRGSVRRAGRGRTGGPAQGGAPSVPEAVPHGEGHEVREGGFRQFQSEGGVQRGGNGGEGRQGEGELQPQSPGRRGDAHRVPEGEDGGRRTEPGNLEEGDDAGPRGGGRSAVGRARAKGRADQGGGATNARAAEDARL